MAAPGQAFGGYRPQAPTDVWSIKERLALACSVLRSGDQNWVSVSRAIRPFGEPNRTNEWFSQKNCALQYSALLEKVEAPKRKRAERGESDTAPDLIARRLANERTDELKKCIQENKQKYKKLKRELEVIRAGQFDDKLPQIWQELQQNQQKQATASSEDSAAPNPAAASRSPAKSTAPALAAATTSPPKMKRVQSGLKLNTSMEVQDVVVVEEAVTDTGVKVEEKPSSSVQQTLAAPQLDVKPKATPPSSPLLSSLLKNKHELQKALSAQQSAASGPPQQQVVRPAAPSTSATESEASVVKPISTTPVVKSEVTLHVPTIEVKEEPIEIDVIEDIPVKKEIPEPKKTQPAPVVLSISSPTPTRPPATTPTIIPTITPTTTIVTPTSTTTVSGSAVSNTTVKTEPSPSPSVVETKEDTPKSATSDTPSLPSIPSFHSFPTTPTTKNQIPTFEDAGKVLVQIGVDDDPASPASSIVSNETDSGSAKGLRTYTRQKQRRTSGKNSRRISQRITRGKLHDDATSTGKPSEAESSDEETTQAESDDGTITMTPKLSLSMSESVPNSPASLSQYDTEDERVYKLWKKSIMLVWRAAANHKFANVFLHPVTNEIAPGYTSVVTRPMDLSAIKKNIESGANRTTAEFQRDMMLMFTNAIMYNNSDHDVYNMAVEMYNDVMSHIEQYVNTQMMVQTEGTKVLRQSRRSEASMSDKEEDPKKRKPSAELDHSLGGKVKKRK